MQVGHRATSRFVLPITALLVMVFALTAQCAFARGLVNTTRPSDDSKARASSADKGRQPRTDARVSPRTEQKQVEQRSVQQGRERSTSRLSTQPSRTYQPRQDTQSASRLQPRQRTETTRSYQPVREPQSVVRTQPRQDSSPAPRSLGRTPRDTVQSRSKDAETQRAEPRPSVSIGRSAPSTDLRTDRSVSSRHESRDVPVIRDIRNTPVGSYRKDYESIGQIWKQRSERRDTYLDSRRRHGDYNDEHGDYRRDRHVDIDIHYHYPWYWYDYRPAFCLPSIYCFYYDWFPPYIQSVRVVYVPTVVKVYRYTDLPLVVIDDTDDYYLASPGQASYGGALRDIQRAWERNDPDLIRDYLMSGSRVAIFVKGEYAYSIDAQDYYDMTTDAMQTIRTKDFRFERIRRRDNGDVVAYGRHTYYDADDNLKTVYVSYTLERDGSDWFIAEAGSSPTSFRY